MDVFTVVLTFLFCFFLSKFLSFMNYLEGHDEVGSSQEVAAKLRDYSSKRVGGLGFVGDVVQVRVLSETEQLNSHLQQPGNRSCGSPEMAHQRTEEIPLGVDTVDESADNEAGHSESIFQVCESSEIADQPTEEISMRVNMAEESVEGESFRGTEVDLVKDELGMTKSEDEIQVSESENKSEEGCVNEGQLEKEEEEEDWEGIESTQLERVFGAAVCFVGCGSNADQISKLANDIKMQMYGLHKVATQGPCLQPRPMPLKVSARAKWNAWHKASNISPEEAMEQYIYLLSRSIPGWMQDNIGYPADAKESRKLSSSDTKTFPVNRASAVGDRSLYEPKA
ncbi:hypothetical protein SLEP1_g8288 [Rubroshorea leprosula]|uniref:ACB domain-containing protein n=1 Tax=Rubroshorea leprosula TaxID=152421 RepID=A0AAV5IC76_9ROSI|nr:hypothetical protein SLEP1_g8288 [Rubroshorea leprosula]